MVGTVASLAAKVMPVDSTAARANTEARAGVAEWVAVVGHMLQAPRRLPDGPMGRVEHPRMASHNKSRGRLHTCASGT